MDSGASFLVRVPLAEPSPGVDARVLNSEDTSCIEQSRLLKSDPCADDGSQQTEQGLIRLYKLRGLGTKSLTSMSKKRRRWLCEQLGLHSRCKRESNFLNLTDEEMQAKSEALLMGENVSKDLKTRKTLDASVWHYSKFRSSIWGHLNADEEDCSGVIVKNLEKWYSHDVFHNTKFDVSRPSDEAPLRGKHIVPNQGKGWSFRERHEGKAKVYGLPCMTQPKLQLYYT